MQPSESVQINSLEAVQSEKGWIFIILPQNSEQCYRPGQTQMKISVWGQLEFLHNFGVAILMPLW